MTTLFDIFSIPLNLVVALLIPKPDLTVPQVIGPLSKEMKFDVFISNVLISTVR